MGVACGKRNKSVKIAAEEDGSFRVSTQWGLRVVCISDTHSFHKNLDVPNGDILIHAGDFTLYGKEEHAHDFNEWLGTLPHKTKIVIVGNHENNADWHKRAAEILTNAVFLRNTHYAVTDGPCVYGTDFYWPCKGQNPYYDAIPSNMDVIIAHGPAQGCVDADKGCEAMLGTVQRIKPKLVISGHVHFGHGVAVLRHDRSSSNGDGNCTVLVNCANCGSGKDERKIVHPAVVVDI